MLRFFSSENTKVLLFLLLLEKFLRKLLLLFTQIGFFTKYFYSITFGSNYFYFYSSTKQSYSSQLCYYVYSKYGMDNK